MPPTAAARAVVRRRLARRRTALFVLTAILSCGLMAAAPLPQWACLLAGSMPLLLCPFAGLGSAAPLEEPLREALRQWAALEARWRQLATQTGPAQGGDWLHLQRQAASLRPWVAQLMADAETLRGSPRLPFETLARR